MKPRLLLFATLILALASMAFSSEPKEDVDNDAGKTSRFSQFLEKTKETFSREHKEEIVDDDQPIFSKAPTAPRPFNVEYKASLNAMPTGLKALATLRKDDDHYLFQLEANNWILSYFEKSAFIWNENSPCDLLTESYQFTFEGFGHVEAFQVHIDQENHKAYSQSTDGSKEYQVPANVSDALAYLFKLQCDLRNNDLNPDYRIAYENGVDHYVFKYEGKETLRTSLGKLETLVLHRVYPEDEDLETTYWIAPELDYLMVKMKHKQGKLVTATLKIKEIDFKITDPETDENEE